MATDFRTFDEFWPYYVGEHSKRSTRAMHAAGTTTALAVAVAALIKRRPSMLLGALVVGYGPAWVSHFFIEKNRPATFKYPRWSLIGDFKMLGLMLTGQMDAEIARIAAAREAEQASAAAAAAGKTGSSASSGVDSNLPN